MLLLAFEQTFLSLSRYSSTEVWFGHAVMCSGFGWTRNCLYEIDPFGTKSSIFEM